MFCTSSGIFFYKFLPHCKSEFLKSYVAQLVEEFKKQHQITCHPDALQDDAFVELKQEFYFMKKSCPILKKITLMYLVLVRGFAK